jgi:hypothetical protein
MLMIIGIPFIVRNQGQIGMGVDSYVQRLSINDPRISFTGSVLMIALKGRNKIARGKPASGATPGWRGSTIRRPDGARDATWRCTPMHFLRPFRARLFFSFNLGFRPRRATPQAKILCPFRAKQGFQPMEDNYRRFRTLGMTEKRRLSKK